MIFFDNFESWNGSFREILVHFLGRDVLDNLASSKFEYIEDAGDFLVNSSDIERVSTEIEDWIRSQEFCVFHGTRLMPEEIISVKKEGLRTLVATDRKKRLTKILSRHPKWLPVESRLSEVLEDVGPREKQGRRQEQVHFSLSREALLNCFDHYLGYGSEFDQNVVQLLFGDKSGLQLLKSETAPVIVHVCFSGEQLIQGAHPHFTYSDVVGMGEVPGLASTFMNAWAYKAANPKFEIKNLRTDCCMMERIATPPERILRIEELGNSVEV